MRLTAPLFQKIRNPAFCKMPENGMKKSKGIIPLHLNLYKNE